MQHLFFSVCLISLSIINNPQGLSVVTNSRIPFFFMAEKYSIVSVCDISHTFFIHSSFIRQQTLRLFPRIGLWSRKTKFVFPAQLLMTLGAIVNFLTLLFLMGSKEILKHLIPIQKFLFGIEHSAWNVVSAYCLLTQVRLLVIQRTL